MESEAPQSGTIGGLPAAKRELRRMIRGRIAELDAAARQAVSLDICRKLAALAREKDYRRVAVFAARPGEVDLLPLLDMMPEREWYFPLVHEGRRLSFHRVCHGGEFVTGSWDIREPGPACPELHAGELDLIVLPGAAFTRDGRKAGLRRGVLRYPAGRSGARRSTGRRLLSLPASGRPTCGTARQKGGHGRHPRHGVMRIAAYSAIFRKSPFAEVRMEGKTEIPRSGQGAWKSRGVKCGTGASARSACRTGHSVH